MPSTPEAQNLGEEVWFLGSSRMQRPDEAMLPVEVPANMSNRSIIWTLYMTEPSESKYLGNVGLEVYP